MSAIITGSSISLTRGDTLYVQLRITKDDEEYVPVVGDQFRFALKKKITDAEPLILKSIPTDTLILKIEPEDTKSLSFGSYRYDIEYTSVDGDVDTFIGPATFNITEEVH